MAARTKPEPIPDLPTILARMVAEFHARNNAR
jgi:hypothetical protein